MLELLLISLPLLCEPELTVPLVAEELLVFASPDLETPTLRLLLEFSGV